MATTTKRRGRPKKAATMTCCRCGETKDEKRFYTTTSKFFENYKRLPVCNECMDDMYMEYYDKYNKEGYVNPDKKAVERVCMTLDIYFKESLFLSSRESWLKNPETSLMMYYMRLTRLGTNRTKTYDDTMLDKYDASKEKEAILTIYEDDDKELDRRVTEGKKIFGPGFEREDYIFLCEQYSDWTARHECSTKSQEELFKEICFTQLNLFKANRAGRDTKTLNDTLIKQLDAAKLQPKQNAGDTTADNQTFGTLIDKWENTRPIPEVDEELRDVDKIGLYIDVFFRGHLAKMLNIKNAFSHLYNKFMEQFTVRKPEYADEEDNEALFDAVFGSASLNDDEPPYEEEEVV